MPDVSQIRQRSDAPSVRWVLFVDGIHYAWTTDTGQSGGSLLGSGPSSWIGLSEASIGGVEAEGARTVLGGLVVPASVRLAVDVKAGELEPAPVTFTLHDHDGALGPLFAREGKAYDVLHSRVAPGTTATAETAVGPGGTAITLWGRHVGLERLGPAGERRLFPALPFELVGYDHAVHQDAPLPGELPPVLVSDEPLAWAGRLVTLFAIYRDPDSPEQTAAAWPTWDTQHAAGGLAWWGVVRGVSRQRGGVFSLDCHGPDALLRRQLGTFTTGQWAPLHAELNLAAGEDSLAILFSAHYPDGSPAEEFDASVFDRTITATTRLDLIDEINGFIADVVDGTSAPLSRPGGVLDTWIEGGTNQDAGAGLDVHGFFVRKREMAANQTFLTLHLALHSRVWRALGYEPETQHVDTQHVGPDDARQIKFRKLDGGSSFAGVFDTGVAVPTAQYWKARLTTVSLGVAESVGDYNDWDNGGARRYWRPKFTTEVYTLDMGGNGQLVRLAGSPFCAGQLTIPASGLDVDGSAANRARLWAVRGKVLDSVESEPVDTVQVALLEWAEGAHGTIGVGASGVQPALRLVRWLDPRTFGLPHRRLDVEYWAGTEGSPLEAVPLHAYAYLLGDAPEYAHSVLSQVLLSTGSGGGYVGGVAVPGDNSVGALPGQLAFGDDLEASELGLAVPLQLVAPLAEIRDAFDRVPGGWAGPLNRVRYAYVGPFLAQDLTGALLRARRLTWRLHGAQYGVTQLASFGPDEADVVLLERDVYPPTADPRSAIPEQIPSPLGHLDGVRLGYRWNPAAQKLELEHVERARDPDARGRTGELVEEITDHGLMPWPWGLPAGVETTPWWDEMRQLWGYDAPTFFGRDHYALRLSVSRPKGQDLWPGSRVVISNPWPVDGDGSTGITARTAIVTAVEIDTRTHARTIEAFVFSGQADGVPHYAPMARVLAQDGDTLTISTDQYEHGDTTIHDGQGMLEPSWSTVGGSARVQILSRVGEQWTLEPTIYAVSTFFAGTSELVLTDVPPTTTAYADRWVVLAPYDEQVEGDYVRALFGPLVLDDLTHGADDLPGRPFQ